MRSSLMPPPSSEGVEQAAPFTIPQSPVRPLHMQQVTAKPATRASQSHLNLVPAEGWLPMALLAVAVYAVVFSIISAGWVDSHANLLYGTATGLLLGLLVAKTRRFPQFILHLAACLAGYWLSVWLTSVIAYNASWLILLEDLRSVISGGLVSPPVDVTSMVFLFYLTFLCFFLGYFGAWLIYRARLPWLVALVYCSIMLVNLQYAKSDLSLLVVILAGALLLLVARIQLSNQLTRWAQEGLHTDRSWLRNITTRFMQVTALMTVLILPLSLLLPTVGQPAAGVSLWNTVENGWVNLMHGQLSLNDPASTLQIGQTTNFFGDQLTITGSVNLPAGQVLYYTSPQSHYLEGFTYNYFDGHTWKARTSGQGLSFPANKSLPLDMPGSSTQATTSITLVNPPGGTKSYIFGPDQPDSFSIPTVIYSDGMTTAWTQQASLSAGEQYQVTSSIPSATVQELSTIPLPLNVPSFWQQDANYNLLNADYLQTPNDLTPDVLATAQQWTRGATNTYDAMNKLVAHFTNQAQFTYSVNNSTVPSNVDAVSWLLKTRRGYCTYYATAMTVMARLLGIPARVVGGFSQGHFDMHRKAWVVDGTDAHSWVQVYFPGQGWIDFDPTPGFSLNNATNPTSPSAGITPTPVKPTPSVTSAHPTPAAHSTPAVGSNGNGSNTLDSNYTTRGMLFLGFSLLILLVALLALVVAANRYRLSKLYANAPIIAGIYWRLSRLASLAGAPPRESQTPYEYTRVLCQRYPRAQIALWRITHLFVRERWSAQQHVTGEVEEKDLERLWHQARGVMLRSLLSRFRASRRIE